MSAEAQTVQVPSSYWMGIKPESDCPVEVLHIAGFDFPKVTEKVLKNPGDRTTYRTQVHGIVRTLYPEDVERIKKRMATKVFRGRRLLSTEHPHYRPQPGDRPVSEFIYLKRVQASDIKERGPIAPVPPDAVLHEEPLDQAAIVNKAAKQLGAKVDPSGVIKR